MSQMTRISIRFTAEERLLLESAAELAHTSLSGFVRHNALEAAEFEVMRPRAAAIPADRWAEFEALAKH